MPHLSAEFSNKNNVIKKSKDISRRKFIGDAAAITALGTMGNGAVVSSCGRKPKYVAPAFLDRAPDGPVLKAGLVGCGRMSKFLMGNVFRDLIPARR